MAQGTPTGTIAANPDDARRAPRRSRGRAGGGSGPMLVNAVLAVVIIGLAAAGWFILTQQERLDSSQRSPRSGDDAHTGPGGPAADDG